MRIHLKRLSDQVIVITGASSGIGLVTARKAARNGARMVLAARSGEELQRLADELTIKGCEALVVVADVGKQEDVKRIADEAIRRFGRFDTWINNAGVSIFGHLMEVPIEDARRLFETNFWGVVYGSLIAVEHLRPRGGALINLGSVVSDRAFPLQGMYSASKAAVKGFTDALRVELEAEHAPISVTLIKPTSIATPFPYHAANYLSVEPTLPPPVYAPETVADAILAAAVHPEREVAVGGASKAMSMGAAIAPRLMDWYQRMTSFTQQQSSRPARRNRDSSLHHASHGLAERGVDDRHIFEHSAYTSARLRPVLTGVAIAAAGLALGGLWNALQGEGHD